MDIRYIRKNIGKQATDDMMNILKDLIMKSDISTINNFSTQKQYHAGDKVYIKEGKKHRVYVCKVANSTPGSINMNEWYHYIEGDVNRYKLNPIDIYEETLTVNTNAYLNYPLQYGFYDPKNTFVAAFNSVQPRLRYGIDFTVTNNGVVKFLNRMNIGEKVILEIRKLNGTIFNNLFREVYIEETYTPLRKTKAVPIRYHGYRTSSKLEIFNKNGELLEEGVHYTLNRAYIVLNEWLQPGEPIHITMWNKVLIKPTSSDYIIDELGEVYRLGVNDNAQLLLTEVGDIAMGNPYIELISENGTVFHCSPTSNKQLTLTPTEPDIILASDNSTHKICIDKDGNIYLQKVESDFYKDIHIVSLDTQLYKLIADENGDLNINKIVNNQLLMESLNYKHIISDDSQLYELTIVDDTLVVTKVERSYNDENPRKFLNLVSESGINFMFFATDDGHLAVRPTYIVDDNSNIILGDDGGLYLLAVTNEGDFYTQELRSAPFVAEHKQITDESNNLYEIHISEDGYVYFENMDSALTTQKTITLDSDAKDEYIGYLYKDRLITSNVNKSNIVRDSVTGIEYAVYVEDNDIVPVRVQTELLEKDYILLVNNTHVYNLCVINGAVKLIDTNVLLPEKENVSITFTNKASDKTYNISIADGMINIK